MIKLDIKDLLWVEKYRPDNLDDYCATTSFMETIKDWLEGNNSHLFFESREGGTGKTTLARIIARSISKNICEVNASLDNGIDIIRNKVKNHVIRRSMDGGVKVVILDEIDNMSIDAIRSLRGLIEKYAKNARFIVTCNNFSRFPEDVREPFRQRFSFKDFSKVHGKTKEERAEVAMKMFDRCVCILKENDVTYEDEAVAQIIRDNFQGSLCFRQIIQDLQDNSKKGVTLKNIEQVLCSDLIEVFKDVHDKKYRSVREFIAINSNRGNILISNLYKNPGTYFDTNSDKFDDLFHILRKAMNDLEGSILPEVVLCSMFLEIDELNIMKNKPISKFDEIRYLIRLAIRTDFPLASSMKLLGYAQDDLMEALEDMHDGSMLDISMYYMFCNDIVEKYGN